jgi:hypothetical protein
MEGKIVAMLLIFALVVTATFGLNFLVEVENKRSELSEARTMLLEIRNGLAARKERLVGLRAKLEGTREKLSIDRARQHLQTDVKSLEAERTKVLSDFSTAVQEVRTKSAGLPCKDISMANGQLLQQVVIQKVTDTDVTFSHSQGVSKIALGELPAELKERFRVGMVPLVVPDVR